MAYLVKALKSAKGMISPGEEIVWGINEARTVEDSCIKYYQAHTDVFTVLSGPSLTPGVAAANSFVVLDAAGNQGAIKGTGINVGATGTETVINPVSFQPGIARAYIDFNTTGEAGMVVRVGQDEFPEADTADAATGTWTNGSSAANSATSLLAAFAGDERSVLPYVAKADVSGAGVWLYWLESGVDGNTSLRTTTPTLFSYRPAAMIHFADVGEAAMSVIINGVSYTEADPAVPATGVWTNGASVENSVDSLVAAINGDTRATVPFTAVKVGTADVFISWDDAENTTAFVISETSAANCTVHQAQYMVFSAVAPAGEKITLGGFIYQEADTASAVDGIWTNGASASDSRTSLVAAINGDDTPGIPFTAVAAAGAGAFWLSMDAPASSNSSVYVEASSSACTVGDATGGAAVSNDGLANITHTVTANELLSGSIDFPLPFAPVTWNVQALTSAGAPVYFTDTITKLTAPDRLRITLAGGTHVAAGNIIHLIIVG